MLRKLRYQRFVTLIGLLLLLMLVLGPGWATAGNEDFQEDKLNAFLERQLELKENQKQLVKDIAASKTKKTAFEQEIVALDAQLVTVGLQIDAAETTVNALNEQIVSAQTAIADATVRLNERQAYLESRLKDIYINGDITMTDVLFSSASFDEYIVLYDMVHRIMIQDKEVLEDINTERQLIEQEEAKLQKAKADEEYVLAELENRNTELSNLHQNKAKAANELTMTIAQLEAQHEEMVAADKEVEELINKELAKRPKVAYYGGQFIWPLPSDKTNITSEYGNRFHPILKRNIMHTGIDIGAPGGTEIYAVGSGEIIFRGWLGGYGQAIMVDHGGGIVTLYAHMSRFGSYNEGDMVARTKVIGYVGSTGQSTGNHLHFEVRLNGSHTDPHPYLGR
ncbi:MAG: peptidoglycan DD-metalloendopeptidase family protein [Firmicutes bacterium]|nr:peptidoglycan DD-metalloendopeptidase family protein [Bacillota bacterium]